MIIYWRYINWTFSVTYVSSWLYFMTAWGDWKKARNLSRWSVCQLGSKAITFRSHHKTPICISANFWSRILEYRVRISATLPGTFHHFLQLIQANVGLVRHMKQTTTVSFNVLIHSHSSSLPQHPKVHILWNRWPTIIRWYFIQWHLTQFSELFTFEFLSYLEIACRLW